MALLRIGALLRGRRLGIRWPSVPWWLGSLLGWNANFLYLPDWGICVVLLLYDWVAQQSDRGYVRYMHICNCLGDTFSAICWMGQGVQETYPHSYSLGYWVWRRCYDDVSHCPKKMAGSGRIEMCNLRDWHCIAWCFHALSQENERFVINNIFTPTTVYASVFAMPLLRIMCVTLKDLYKTLKIFTRFTCGFL